MTATTADDLRTNLIGAWTLQSYEARSTDGTNVTYPLGVDAKGIIMYTADGYMSAQLMRSGQTPFGRDAAYLARDDELATAAGRISHLRRSLHRRRQRPDRPPRPDQPAAQLDRRNPIPHSPPAGLPAGAQPARTGPDPRSAPQRQTRLAPCGIGADGSLHAGRNAGTTRRT